MKNTQLEALSAAASGVQELRVHVAGLDRGTWHIMAGLPYPIRLAGYGGPEPGGSE
jgi:hypothetical protein